MTGIALLTAGDDALQEFYTPSVVDGYEPDAIADCFDNGTLESVVDPHTGKVHLWGTSVESKIQSVEAGDIALLYDDGEYFAQARVVGQAENPDLAEDLWDVAETSDDGSAVMPYLTFLGGVEEIAVAASDVNSLIDYSEDYYPKGLTPVADARLEPLQDAYGSVEAAVAELTGADIAPWPPEQAEGSRGASPAPSSVLVQNQALDSGQDICRSLLSVGDPDDTHLLHVSFDGLPEDRLAAWRAHNGQMPASTGVVVMGESTRSSASRAPAGPGPNQVTVDAFPEPSDLTGLAMAISSYLEAWERTEATMVFCLESITPLLIHCETERVFRFLHSTLARLREAGAYAHFHIDQTAHAESTVNVVEALFDTTLEVDADGSVSIHRHG